MMIRNNVFILFSLRHVRRSMRRSGVISLAAAALLVLGAASCSAGDAELPDNTDSHQEAAARNWERETLDRLEREVREARDEAKALRGRLEAAESRAADAETCEDELAETTAELLRYQDGLDRAVAQLNRSSGAAGSGAAPAPRTSRQALPTPSAARKDPGRITSRIGPDVQILGYEIFAYGELWSYRDEDTRVRLTLELFENERSVATETIEVMVPANTDVDYRHRFRRSVQAGYDYIVRARLDY